MRVDPTVWHEEVERFARNSQARIAAECERLERDGVDLLALQRCAAEGAESTALEGLLKVYVPIVDAPPSEHPFGFAFEPNRDADGPYLELVSFGERHPERRGMRSVYERAHRRLHGHYPGP